LGYLERGSFAVRGSKIAVNRRYPRPDSNPELGSKHDGNNYSGTGGPHRRNDDIGYNSCAINV
jgi:hypothetical protein